MRLRSVIKGRRLRLFVQLVANGMGQATITIGIALLIRFAFDRIIAPTSSNSSHMMFLFGGGFVAAAIGTAWLQKKERIDSEQMGQSYIHRIRMKLFDHLTELAPRALQKRSRGSIVLRFVGDLNAIKRWVSLGLARITVAFVTIVGTLFVMFIVNWVLAFGVVTVLALGIARIFRLGKQIHEAVSEGRRRRSFLATNVNEKVASMAVVQVFGQSAREKGRLRRQSNRLRNAMVVRAKKIGTLRAIVQSTTVIATGIVLLLGANEVVAGRVSPGTLVAAMTVVGLLVPSIRDLGRVYEYYHDARISSKKIEQFLKTPTLVSEITDAPDLKAGPGRLEFLGASLSGVVKEVTAVVEPGAVVGLTGPNGAGKSTLFLLAARLMDPDKGKILLDGQDLAKHSIASVRRAVGMVSPDLPLLRGKIEKNLRYRWPDAPAEEIKRTRALCEIDKVLCDLPQGDQTRLAEGGLNLSLGQRQRIAIARALLGNPTILLLDEADAHLDLSANEVLDRVLAEFHGTVLIVTHNPKRLASVDVVWKMNNGQLIEVGEPDEILKNVSSSNNLISI